MYQDEMEEYGAEQRLREREYQRDRREREKQELRSRSGWRGIGRMVIVSDDEALKVIPTKSGHQLRLYSEEQTRERTQEELARDERQRYGLV